MAKRRRIAPEFKAKIALAAAKGDRTVNEIASEFKVHPTQVTQWKRQLLEGASGLFEDGRSARGKPKSGMDEKQVAELYEQIGRLRMELAWMKKKSAGLGTEAMRKLVDPADTDITYIPLGRRGFWLPDGRCSTGSRAMFIAWALSNTMEVPWCVEVLREALLRGRWLDNVFVERLWRTVKYEDVYLRGYETLWDAEAGLRNYFAFYNEERRHQSLGRRTPAEIWRGEAALIDSEGCEKENGFAL